MLLLGCNITVVVLVDYSLLLLGCGFGNLIAFPACCQLSGSGAVVVLQGGSGPAP